jgi:hypothetical protein
MKKYIRKNLVERSLLYIIINLCTVCIGEGVPGGKPAFRVSSANLSAVRGDTCNIPSERWIYL